MTGRSLFSLSDAHTNITFERQTAQLVLHIHHPIGRGDGLFDAVGIAQIARWEGRCQVGRAGVVAPEFSFSRHQPHLREFAFGVTEETTHRKGLKVALVKHLTFNAIDQHQIAAVIVARALTQFDASGEFGETGDIQLALGIKLNGLFFVFRADGAPLQTAPQPLRWVSQVGVFVDDAGHRVAIHLGEVEIKRYAAGATKTGADNRVGVFAVGGGMEQVAGEFPVAQIERAV